MSGAPEYRYTDRDVRENASLAQLAEDYVIQYGGDFEPLVEAKLAIANECELSTVQIRKVLNCMRNDWTVADRLPKPRMALVREAKQIMRVNVDVHCVIRGDYFITLAYNAKYYNKINHELTAGYLNKDKQYIYIQGRTFCSRPLTNWHSNPNYDLVPESEIELLSCSSGLALCPKCVVALRYRS